MDSEKLALLKTQLAGIEIEDAPAVVRRKSRDFYWYSPILKRDLEQVKGDVLITPRSEEDVVRILASAHAHNIPITPRGAGTGNYGQAMPLAGGIVLDMTMLNEIKEIGPGRVIAQAGALIGQIDAAARRHSGQELRMIPSTFRTASIGGFIAGGSGGVGSIRWGGLRDSGNVIRLRLVTMEENPKMIELTGHDIAKVAYAYGTNGVIVECEVPLTAAYDWIDLIVEFDDMEKAVKFADKIGNEDGVLLKELAVTGPDLGYRYFPHYKSYLSPGKTLVMMLVAPHALFSVLPFLELYHGSCVFRSDHLRGEADKIPPSLIEHTWNHTTLVARRVEADLTYLQILYPYPDHLAAISRMKLLLGDEIIEHLEFSRFEGHIACFGLTLIRYTSEARLDEVVQLFEKNNCLVFNPHRYTLEEGGMKKSDPAQLAFKKMVDPKGLLNPGKMIAWENPDFDFTSTKKYLFSTMVA